MRACTLRLQRRTPTSLCWSYLDHERESANWNYHWNVSRERERIMRSFKRSWRKPGKSWKIAKSVSAMCSRRLLNVPTNFSCPEDLYVSMFNKLVEISRVYLSVSCSFLCFSFCTRYSSCKGDSLCQSLSLSRTNWRVERTFWMRYVSFVAVSCSQEEKATTLRSRPFLSMMLSSLNI